MIDYERITLEEIRQPERFCNDQCFVDEAVEWGVEKTRDIMPKWVHKYPSACSVNLKYQDEPNASLDLGSDWTAGFWTGMLWLSYELTGDEMYLAVAEAQYDDYKMRLQKYDCLYHHDIGFLYIPSILAQYKITGAPKAEKLCKKAARLLAGRYCEKAGIIQVRDRDGQGNFIIDCSMNIPLLYWASQVTGQRSYYHMAHSHMAQTAGCMIREDGSTYQCYQIDELSGKPVRGWQGQGFSDESCWARGQAWIIYGLAISYSYTKEISFLEYGKRVANYFLNRLPKDLICNWDIIFTGDEVQRDSSSASIAACGLLELSKQLPEIDDYKQIYKAAAVSILKSLAESYTTKGLESNGLLMHGVYCKDKGDGGIGDDECCIWGDYFYLEGLMRLKKNWNMYW